MRQLRAATVAGTIAVIFLSTVKLFAVPELWWALEPSFRTRLSAVPSAAYLLERMLVHSFSGCLLAALILFGAGTLSAQPAPRPLPRIDAGDLLAGRPVATALEALQPLLAEGGGREVVVTDERGRQRRGRVVSLSPDRIVLGSPVSSGTWEGMLPLYWPADVAVMLKRRLIPSGNRAFDESAVTRIDVVDPTGNGTAIGAAVGASVAAGVYLWERGQPESSLKGLLTVLAMVAGIPISTRMGHVIDRAINEPVYERADRPPRMTLIPLAGQDRAAALIAVRW